MKDDTEVYYKIRLEFKITNNEAEYEAVLARLAIVGALGIKEVDMKADSEVLVNQIIGEYLTKGEKLKRYIQQIHKRSNHFSSRSECFERTTGRLSVWSEQHLEGMRLPYHGRR